MALLWGFESLRPHQILKGIIMRELSSEINKLHHCYTLFISKDQIDESFNKKLVEIGKKVKMPGFRVGHVPMHMLVKNYGDSARQEVTISEVKKTVAEFIRSKDLRPALQPEVKITKTDDTGIEISVNLDVLPEVNLVEIGHPKIKKYNIKVEDKKVDEFINNVVSKSKSWSEKPEGATAEKGDKVTADIRLVTGKKKQKNRNLQDVNIILGDGDFVEQFWSNLLGLKVGDEKEFSVLADDEKIPTKYHVIVKKTYSPKAAELNDELAKSLGLESKDQVRDWAIGVLRGAFKQDMEDLIKKQLLDFLAGSYSFDVPNGMVELETKEIIRQLEFDAQRTGKKLAESYAEKLSEETQDVAVRRVRLGLVIAKLATENKISVSPEELRNAVTSIARMYPGHEAEVAYQYTHDQGLLSAVAGPLLESKVIQLIVDKYADVEETEVTEEEFKKISEQAFQDIGDDYLEEATDGSAGSKTE